MQWNTVSFGPDYRLEPLKAVTETFSFKIPQDAAPGIMTITAEVWYSRLISSVAEFLGVDKEEYEPILINTHKTTLKILE